MREKFDHTVISGTMHEIDSKLIGEDNRDFNYMVADIVFTRMCGIAEDKSRSRKDIQVAIHYMAHRLASKILAMAYYRLGYSKNAVEVHLGLDGMDNIRKMTLSTFDFISDQTKKTDDAH